MPIVKDVLPCDTSKSEFNNGKGVIGESSPGNSVICDLHILTYKCCITEIKSSRELYQNESNDENNDSLDDDKISKEEISLNESEKIVQKKTNAL